MHSYRTRSVYRFTTPLSVRRSFALFLPHRKANNGHRHTLYPPYTPFWTTLLYPLTSPIHQDFSSPWLPLLTLWWRLQAYLRSIIFRPHPHPTPTTLTTHESPPQPFLSLPTHSFPLPAHSKQALYLAVLFARSLSDQRCVPWRFCLLIVGSKCIECSEIQLRHS